MPRLTETAALATQPSMSAPLFRRRTIWWPTLLGWAALCVCVAAAGSAWCLWGEGFLSLTERRPAEVLVIEGWIGADGIRAAKGEFDNGGYLYAVATGGQTGDKWDSKRWSYAREAEEQLLRLGVPRGRLILAEPRRMEIRRTFESALAVSAALSERGIHPQAVNVFTKGPHARRSRLVFAKVFPRATEIGVVAWTPPGYAPEPWWHSSERAGDFIKESAGWVFEVLLNSGRLSSSPPPEEGSESPVSRQSP